MKFETLREALNFVMDYNENEQKLVTIVSVNHQNIIVMYANEVPIVADSLLAGSMAIKPCTLTLPIDGKGSHAKIEVTL